jgi:glycosyltransferase involved in cell wall biosynthesis
MKVWGWQGDRGGCAHYRIIWPLDAIRAQTTWEIGYGTVIPPDYRDSADVVIGQRVCLDGPSRLWQRWAAEGTKRLVYELDDDFWNIPEYNGRGYRFYSRPDVQANLADNIRAAHTVTVSTEHLADEVENRFGHDDVRVIRNALPAEVFEHHPELVHDIGWGGSPTHSGDVSEQMVRGVRRLLTNDPMLTFMSIGASILDRYHMPAGQYHKMKWVPDPMSFIKSISYRVAIAPLAPNRFNRSKSDIKILEAAALGIPSVASNVGPYKVIDDGLNGYIVRYDHEWQGKIKSLVYDADSRRIMGDNARRWAMTRTTDISAAQWIAAISGT